MLCRLTVWMLLGAVCGCEAPPPSNPSAPPAAEQKAQAATRSKQQISELSERCAKTSRDQFRRDWKDGIVPAPDGQWIAEFSHHYNAKRRTCFYLLTVIHSPHSSNQSGASPSTVRAMLFDIHSGEQYGEYLGPAPVGASMAGLPATCRIEAMYCASQGEWDVLLEPYMGD